MPTISPNTSKTVSVTAGDLIVIGSFGPGTAIVSYAVLPQVQADDFYEAVRLLDGSSGQLGPFGATRLVRIDAGESAVEYVTGADPVLTAAGPRLTALETKIATATDVLQMSGAGAPVDYTDGTPPATGEGTAGIGSQYTDTTAGNLYLNGGTKAEPVWKLITRAA